GFKGTYETLHTGDYTDEAIGHAVLCATKYIKTKSRPGAAADIIDEAGAAAQLEQGSLPEEVVEVQKIMRFIVKRLKASTANHEFEKAHFYSHEERKESDNLKQLREKYKVHDNPNLNLRTEEI